MRVSAALLLLAAAGNADAAGKGTGGKKTTTTTTRIRDSNFEDQLCQSMIDDVYGQGTYAVHPEYFCSSDYIQGSAGACARSRPWCF